MGRRTATTLTGLALTLSIAFSGCGVKGLAPPTPACAPCVQTEETVCDFMELEEGTKVLYETTPGDVDKKPIAYTHGLSQDYRCVYDVIRKGGHPILTWSVPGHYGSDSLHGGKEHTIERAAEIFEKLIRHNQDFLGDDYIRMGASMGGMIVAEHACRYPDDRTGVVMLVSQDFAPDNLALDLIDFYVTSLGIKPLQEYVCSIRNLYLCEDIQATRNNWVIVSGQLDRLTPDGKQTADRLGERAHYYEIKGAGHSLPSTHKREVDRILEYESPFLMQR